MAPSVKSPDDLKAIARILGGVPIWGVLPGSAAHRAGMRYGDIVTRVNGITTQNMTEFLRAQNANPERVDFEIVRQGVVVHLELQLDERVWS